MPNFKVKAVYEYNSPHEDDLSFPLGQIITVTEQEDDEWYVGDYTDDSGVKKEGLFPKNFVEKYEPEPPPRPNRASRHKPLEAPAPAPEPPTPEIPQQEEAAPAHEEVETPKPSAPSVEIPAAAKSHLSPISPPSATSSKSAEVPQSPPAAPKPVPAKPAGEPAKAKSPPPVAAKSSSFRDRIAAFNAPAAAPITPFKPGGGPPSTFIKKPFVAPPPSRNAYVPPPREAPQVKTYRREEDPEIAERTAQDQENADKAGLSSDAAAAPAVPAEEGEEQPKPTSLKERIALLQKQQMEQAQRAAASQKEKPKKPPPKPKRTGSHERRAAPEGEGADLDRVQSGDTVERGSIDAPRESRPPRPPPALKSPDIMPQGREPFSDGNDADQSGAGETEDAEGTSTGVDDEEDRPKPRKSVERAPAAPLKEPDVGDEQEAEEEEEEEEEEEDEMDAETRRKMELRERMAKMSGGMGMGAMFGPPGGLPMGGLPPKKTKSGPEKKTTEDSNESYASSAPRVPMVPVPGMQRVRSPESEDTQLAVEKEDEPLHPITDEREAEEVPDMEDVKPQRLQRTHTGERGAPPPPPNQQRPVPPPMSPTDRGAPPPIPSSSRPPPPPSAIRSPSPGSESGDELTGSTSELPIREPAPPMSPKVPSNRPSSKRSSYLASDEMSQDSSSTLPERRVPPIPLASPTMSSPAQSRPPPPPPPTGFPPSRQQTMDSISKRSLPGDRSEGETEYEGDYDTDIAPGATHKDALKSHARDSSHDDSTIADDTPPVRSPITSGPPPLPQSAARRAVPPPPPQQPPSSRKSMDAPRNQPPPVPSRDPEDDDDYDPYRYGGSPPRAVPPPPKPQAAPPPPQNRPPPPMPPPAPQQEAPDESSDEDDLYASPPPRKSHDRPPPPPPQAPPHVQQPPLLPRDRQAPPPPPQERPVPRPPPPESAPSSRPAPRKSLDVNRVVQQSRPSMDQPRPSMGDQGFIANDIDLGHSTHWWTQPNMLPPSLQSRRDVLTETGESRSGNSVEKSIMILYMDYSQTIVTAMFDTRNVSDVQLEQRHEPPPNRLRQDQLEAAHEDFGLRIAKDIEGKQNTVVGDGSPQALVYELLRPYNTALKPISTRSFGALVYANLANASIQQYDEIRAGDIISFRNAKFEGKHGAMHAKYKMEVGKPDHVGVVVDWDGTKKKVRAWEQGRESKKVKVESFKMGDLRSGEVRVWRVMGRGWVGWSE